MDFTRLRVALHAVAALFTVAAVAADVTTVGDAALGWSLYIILCIALTVRRV